MKASLWRAFGALIGLGAGIGAGIGLREALSGGAGWALAGIGIAAAVWILVYLLVQHYDTPENGATEYMLGLLLGLNTGINAVLLQALLGLAAAIVICAIPLLATIKPLARWQPYQFVLGWTNWVLPTSWPIVALGAVVLAISGLLCWIPATFTRIVKFRPTLDGTWVTFGGLGGNLTNINPNSGGYNLGTFAFVPSRRSTNQRVGHHEGGHTLNLAIWGSVVHLIGAVDEVINHQNAYTEQFAEGNVPQTLREGWRTVFPMWGDPAAAGAPPAPAPPAPTPPAAPAPAPPAPAT
jgi:hypothetical protein